MLHFYKKRVLLWRYFPFCIWQRILALETLRERNSQQLLGKEQEISSLRQQLRASHGDVVSSLQSQLEQKQHEAQQREKQFQALSQETEDLKNKYCAVSERCDTLEKQKVGEVTLDPSYGNVDFP